MKRLAAVGLLIFLLAQAALAAMPGDDVNALIHMPLPPQLDIAGEPVPLDREDVAERLEYELLIMLGNPVQTALWLKRYPRYMLEVEREIAMRGVPEDLKYVSIIESSLRPEAVSSAGAVGPWQFMAATGREFGLNRESWVDERRDWARSTRAALDYLKELRGHTTSWALALASYNAGPGRVRQAQENQKHEEFWGLVLPEETERYVFRFLAAKVIMTHPQLYGIDMTGARLYDDRTARAVSVEVKRARMPLLALSKAAGISYRYFLRLNPAFIGGDLPRGTHTVFVPADKVDLFQKALENWKKANPEAPTAVAKKESKPAKPVPVISATPPPKPSGPVIEAATDAPVFPPPGQAVLPTAGIVAPPPLGAISPTAPASPLPPAGGVAAPPEVANTILAPAPPATPLAPEPTPGADAQTSANDVAFPTPKEGVVSYIVKKGDTLSAIARKFSVTIEKLRVQNGLAESNALQPGQTLVVVPKPE